MKKNFLSLVAIAALGFGIASCSNNGDNTASNDSTGTTNTTTATTTTTSSSGNYAAMADTVEANSAKGYYLNPKTGKPYGKLTVDRTSGRITTEAGEPVWRYVDNRSWWVYGGNDWRQMGQAKMQNDQLMFQDSSNNWVDYNTRWSKEDEDNMNNMKVSDNGNKVKVTTDEGDKIKMKTDEEGNTKMKVNDQKMKVDSNGNVIKH